MLRHRSIVLILLTIVGCTTNRQQPPGRDQTGPPPTFLPEPIRVVMEVESGEVQAPFEVEDHQGVGGRRCVVLAEKWATRAELHPPLKTQSDGRPVSKAELASNPLGSSLVPNGSITVPFTIGSPGRYTLWARVEFAHACADSMYVNVDADLPVDTDGNGSFDENAPYQIGGSTWNRWTWVKLRHPQFELGAGDHILSIYPREDGIRIDQVLLARDPIPPVDDYEPSGIEESGGG